MKSLLVPVTPEANTNAAVLATAGALAQARGSHIAGVASVGMEFLATGEFFSGAEFAIFEERRTALTAAAKSLFTDGMGAAHVPAGPPGASSSWMWVDDTQGLTVPELARAHDLTVVGLPGPRPAVGATALLEGCLFESGRPVLVVPADHRPGLGRAVAVAWNGSSETARTLSFAMPLLRDAEQITVIQVEGVGVKGPSAEDIAVQLRRHGLPVSAKVVPLQSRQPGEAFLREAEAVGADLMVKGAYTQSRLRQMIFGGATAYLLANATMPMIMAN